MSRINCKHCGQAFDEQQNYCPGCQTPTAAQQEINLEKVKKKFIYFFIGLIAFCIVMILWLPR